MANKAANQTANQAAEQTNQLIERIEYLESQVAFLEDNQEQLNQALISQQQQISEQNHNIRLLVEKIKAGNSSQIASEAEETPPPHY